MSLYHVKCEPMPGHKNKAMGDPTIRYRVLLLHVPASYIDWKKAKTMGSNLTGEQAEELEDRMYRQYVQQPEV